MGLSRLQNRDAKFLQQIFSHHAKNFWRPSNDFFNILLKSKCVWKYELRQTRQKCLSRLQKFLCIMQKFLYDTAKTTFCSLESLGSGRVVFHVIRLLPLFETKTMLLLGALRWSTIKMQTKLRDNFTQKYLVTRLAQLSQWVHFYSKLSKYLLSKYLHCNFIHTADFCTQIFSLQGPQSRERISGQQSYFWN